MIHAAFEHTPETAIAEAAYQRLLEPKWGLTGDGGYFKEWSRIELESLLSEGNVITPALGVAIDRTDETRVASSGTNEIEVGMVIAITQTYQLRETDGWLRQRIIGRIKKAFSSTRGCLYGPNGEQLSDALLSYGRIPQPLRRGSHITTAVRAVFRTWIDEPTREVI